MMQHIHDLHDQYVPRKLRDEKAFAAFNKELLNAVTCCEAVEKTPWSATEARQVIRRASQRKGRSTVTAVSLPSQPSCAQRFMAFEAREDDGHMTYILAFRSDKECYKDLVSKPEGYADVETNNTFQVHASLWWRAATMPLHSLPPHWRSGLQYHRHRLLLTGFSVGGAVAALATLQLLEDEDPYLQQQICCYTFGAPLQGDENYANCINLKFMSNFYHVMINGDPIPGILTLLSKVSMYQPDTCRDVASTICSLLASTAQVAAGVALNTVAPGVGSLVLHIDFEKLGNYIKNLVSYERKSTTPLPEYKFGGSLVLLDRTKNHMCFDGCRVFCVQEMNITPSSLQQLEGVPRLNTFRQVIDNLDNDHLYQAIKYESGDWMSGEPAHSQRHYHGLSHLSGKVKDGAGRVIEKTSQLAAIKCVQPKDVDDEDEEPSTSTDKWLLEPKFDVKTPIRVWLDNHENVTIEVYGENMVLGVHVLYLVKDKEMLRIPCTEKYVLPQWVESKDPEKPAQQTVSNLPLQFSIQGTEGLSFKESGGCYRIQLAFGSHDVEATKVQPSLFDALRVLQVAERFSTEPPSKLIDLLIFWGMATAQAQCLAAHYDIQKNPRDADNTVKKILKELCDVPPEFDLLDRLLSLVDTTQFGPLMLDKLPAEMGNTLRRATNASEGSDLLVPYFRPDNDLTKPWTFCGCYTRTIKRMITKEMLSKKETAEELSKSLDKELAVGPKQMVVAYVNYRIAYKSYAKEFSIKSIESWNREKATVRSALRISAMSGGALPLVTVPLYFAGQGLESTLLTNSSKLIGFIPAALTAGLCGGVWLGYHFLFAPLRYFKKKPGLMSDKKRYRVVADDWEKKLESATLLFQCKPEPPHVACRLEYKLFARLEAEPTKVGFYNIPGMQYTVDKARYEAVTALKLANYGVAGALMYEIRRHLTKRKTALGLIGTSQSGKSTFAAQAFGVDSHPGAGMDSRTRALRYWPVPFSEDCKEPQFMLIDFPGSTDHAAPHWYIRGQSLASVLVIVSTMKEINSDQTLALVKKAIEVRRKDKEVSVLFCFNCADTVYEQYEGEASGCGSMTAADLFVNNFQRYKEDILSKVADDAGQLAYIGSNMHACCFAPNLQDGSKGRAGTLQAAEIKNVDCVKQWCLKQLRRINGSKYESDET